MIRRGRREPAAIRRGRREVQRVYRGRRLVWEKGVEPHTLDGIYIDSSPDKILYQSGELLDLSGLLVYAAYSDGMDEDVTSACVFTPAEGEPVIDSQTVYVSYSEGDITVTTDFEVFVEEPAINLDYSFNSSTGTLSFEETEGIGDYQDWAFDDTTQELVLNGGQDENNGG